MTKSLGDVVLFFE